MGDGTKFLKLVGPGVFEGRDQRGTFWRIKCVAEGEWRVHYGPAPDGPLIEGEFSPMDCLVDARDGVEVQIRFETDPVFREIRKQRVSQRKKERRLARARETYQSRRYS